MSDLPSESERRLRAALRAFLSHGVWLTIVFEMTVAMLPHLDVGGWGNLRFALLGLFAALAIYLQAGTMLALARGREVVGIPEVLANGKDVFPRFVWLLLKAAFLFIVFLNVVLLLLNSLGAIQIEDQDAAPTVAGLITGVIVPTKFVLAYWLPWVFAHQDFRLLPTLQAALRMAWARLPRAGLFLAALLLIPGAVLVGLPREAPLFVMSAAMLVAVVLDWVAFSYCVDVARAAPARQGPENP
ncbi:MAG: hypothetical protein JSW09_09480 [Pseudomonadota bacterium]|nr:MAG: hypothetical protein JSW09_09480 [Pseudomonadota bacterium]